MAGLDITNVTIPVGILRHAVFEDIGPSWLRYDGKTEYQRSMYPEFVAKATGRSWFLAGSTPATFKLIKVPAGTATVASGFDALAGEIVGSDKLTLLMENLPEHDHTYMDSTDVPKAGTAGLLSGTLPIMTGVTISDKERRTGKAGATMPTPVKNQPPGFVAHLFVFAGRPKK